MSGRPRKLSESGFYHVITKGNNGRVLFEDEADFQHYIKLMKIVTDDTALKYHAWCLMSNHVHILVEDEKQEMSKAMGALSRRYTEHYRSRYDHVGSLYTGRFWSEPIESDEYLLCAMRYIHHNPQAAGICNTSQYRWSSIQDYLGSVWAHGITTTDAMINLCDGLEGFISFHKSGMTAKPFTESKLRNHISDTEAAVIAQSVLREMSIAELRTCDPKKRTAIAKKLRQTGLTVRQIAHLSGLGIIAVEDAIRSI